jgi:hypothetical protein
MKWISVVLFLAVMIGTPVPIGAAEMNPGISKVQTRAKKLAAGLEAADYVKSGDALPDFVKAAIASIPKDSRPNLQQVYFVTDLHRFMGLAARIAIQLAFSENCDPDIAQQIHPQCEERIRQLAENDLPKLKSLNVFVLDNHYPVFINGEDIGLIQNGIKDFARGSQIPVRILRARMIHEFMHAQGEVSESRCYSAEIKELWQDEKLGFLPDPEYIRKVERFQAEFARREKLIASR